MAPNRGALAGPRVLLRKLREVMAEPIGAQQRLDKVVTLIAANMVAEVCSVYVLRADNVLELYATQGLKASSVHRASLTVGRGLVGLIAAEAFRALAGRGINIQLITTSEIKISILIDAAYTELAVRTLHSIYELDKT